MRTGCLAILAVCVPLSMGCGGGDIPDADQLPLAQGVETAAEKTGYGDDNYRHLALLLTGSDGMTPRDINAAEIDALRGEGWKIRRYRDRTANAYEKGGDLWAYVGLDGGCPSISKGLRSEPRRPYICASLGQ